MDNPLKVVMGWGIGIGSLALFLLVMAILFGNLSGNTGIADGTVTNTVTNETSAWLNATNYGLSGYNTSWSGITVTALWNASTGGVGVYNLTIPVAQARVLTGGNINSTNATAYTNVSVSYTYVYTYQTQEETNAESIIGNYTTSTVNTSAQFPTIGTILGVVVLLVLLVAVLIYAVRKMSSLTSSGGKGSEYPDGDFA